MQRGVAVMLLALWRAPVAALRAGGGAALRPRGTKPFGAFTRIPSAKAKRQANADAAKRKKAPTAASVRRREAREADAPAVAEGPAGAANPFGASPFGAGLPPIAGLMGGFDADFDIDDDDFDEDDEDDDDDDDDDGEEDPDSNKPPTLPSGAFRPKQSLGQNYLSDQNFVLKICNSLKVPEADAAKVVELGPGLGALTRILVKSYPEMLAVEIDERAVVLLRERYPAPTTILHCDVLELDYAKLAELKGGRLSVIGNLPYYITSQILFQFVDYHKYVARAAVTMQLEVAQRLVAKPRSKEYGILSVVFQLYCKPTIAFKIPPAAFYPVPKVTSALVTIEFPEVREKFPVDPKKLRTVIRTAFGKRRKMLRHSLKPILEGKLLSEEWARRRPEELEPPEFLKLTAEIFGPSQEVPTTAPIWRKDKSPQRASYEQRGNGDFIQSPKVAFETP